jgi:hypothetical protein
MTVPAATVSVPAIAAVIGPTIIMAAAMQKTARNPNVLIEVPFPLMGVTTTLRPTPSVRESLLVAQGGLLARFVGRGLF